MDDAFIEARISELGLALPPPPSAVAAYLPVKVVGGFAYVAGQVPMLDGILMTPGLVGADVSVEDAADAARQGALQALSALHAALGGFGRLLGIAQVTVYVASPPGFTEHPKVANGASEFLVAVMGEPGRHARAAVGTSSLPLGSCVEVAVTAEIDVV